MTGHYPSGEPVQIPHTFSGEGTFEVKVWAFDEHGDAYNGLPCWSEPLYVVVGSGPLPEEADIEITLSDNPDPVKKRQSVVYTSVVSNLGPDPAPGVSFSQTVPARTTVVSTSTSQGSCSSSSTTVDCDLGTIEAGNTVTVEVEIETKRPGTIEVTATAGTGSLPDPDSSNNSATETTTVTR